MQERDGRRGSEGGEHVHTRCKQQAGARVSGDGGQIGRQLWRGWGSRCPDPGHSGNGPSLEFRPPGSTGLPRDGLRRWSAPAAGHRQGAVGLRGKGPPLHTAQPGARRHCPGQSPETVGWRDQLLLSWERASPSHTLPPGLGKCVWGTGEVGWALTPFLRPGLAWACVQKTRFPPPPEVKTPSWGMVGLRRFVGEVVLPGPST